MQHTALLHNREVVVENERMYSSKRRFGICNGNEDKAFEIIVYFAHRNPTMGKPNHPYPGPWLMINDWYLSCKGSVTLERGVVAAIAGHFFFVATDAGMTSNAGRRIRIFWTCDTKRRLATAIPYSHHS